MRYSDAVLKAVHVTVRDREKLEMQCDLCLQQWNAETMPEGRLAPGWWRCPNGCTPAAAVEGIYFDPGVRPLTQPANPETVCDWYIGYLFKRRDEGFTGTIVSTWEHGLIVRIEEHRTIFELTPGIQEVA